MRINKSSKYIQSSFPGWNYAANYEFSDLGRIWVIWDPSVNLSIHSKSKQVITCVVRLPNSDSDIAVSYVYGVNCKIGRELLWDELRALSSDPIVSSKVWVVLGDFNQTVNPMDSSTGSTRISKGITQFRDCIADSGHSDLTFRGSHYTWSNNQTAKPLAKKLDRILVNDAWLLSFPVSYGHFGDRDFSDHCPCSVIIGNRVQTKAPFKISHFLLDHEDFIPRLKNFWETSIVVGTAMFRVSKNLKLLKPVIKDINRVHYSDLEKRVQQSHEDMVAVQAVFFADPSVASAERERKAHSSWSKLAIAEEKFLYQKSRVTWASLGDCNSSLFHRSVKERRAGNQIHYLLDDHNNRLEHIADIKSHCVDYYSNLLDSSPPVLSSEAKDEISRLTTFRCDVPSKEMLMAPVSREEIKKEVFSLPANKAPGPDGYTGEFFRKAWPVIGNDFTDAVQEFFASGQILKQWNVTAIMLVPKSTEVDRVSGFRPISCCNAIYKVVSKILARRLEKVLPVMVSPSQSAFVKGRLLVENVLLATEMVHGFGSKNSSPRGLLKVDIRKAFDSVSWPFILQILEAAEFSSIFVSWIKNCITTTSFSINVNGELCGYFQGKCGLRQGDPISPALFIIAMEAFTSLISGKFDDGQIGYHPLGINPKVSHLCFADDLMIFFDGKRSSLDGIADALEEFRGLSGLGLNKDKTSLFHSGLDDQEVTAVSTSGFQQGVFPIRYLGLPLHSRRLRKSEYSPLIDSIRKRLQSWKVRLLSYAGRLQLIKAVIYNMVNFWLSAFVLPKGCLKEIESLCRDYLWSSNPGARGSAKVAWKDLCLPRNEGGLGLRNFYLWNKALVLRLVWLQFAGSNSLWVAWNREHRLKRCTYWTADSRQSDSWVWRALLSLRPLARRLIGCDIGNGTTASYWCDNWLPHGPLIDFIGATGPCKMGIPISSTVLQACSQNGWILPSASVDHPPSLLFVLPCWSVRLLILMLPLISIHGAFQGTEPLFSPSRRHGSL